MTNVLERQIDQAMGRLPADLVVRNARILNLVTGELQSGDIAVCGSLIVGTFDSYRGGGGDRCPGPLRRARLYR